jgi:hypothetical protein
MVWAGLVAHKAEVENGFDISVQEGRDRFGNLGIDGRIN